MTPQHWKLAGAFVSAALVLDVVLRVVFHVHGHGVGAIPGGMAAFGVGGAVALVQLAKGYLKPRIRRPAAAAGEELGAWG